MAKRHRRKQGPRTITIKIPITAETLTAVMLLLQELVALARVLKVPMQTVKEGKP
ncbi:MAG: hypothetical protein WB661_01550 [Candidatus Bathyarchaeia archaeon]